MELKCSLIVEPGDGVAHILKAIDGAKQRLELMVFRFDRDDVEAALIRAVQRGVAVQALIAWTNRGGERNLRRLEARLLAAGVTVSRTASDLSRYHGKMMIVDRKTLFVLAFNFTSLDIEKSRSFGVIARAPRLVGEAVKLFEADSNRQAYKPAKKTLLVSPVNARPELAEFIRTAEKELLIYDPGVSDPQMVRLLEDRSRAGVSVRIIGTLKRASSLVTAFPMAQMRLHVRAIIRDGRDLFIGSQSLRAAELDARREIGVIVNDNSALRRMISVFEDDWKLARGEENLKNGKLTGDKVAKKVAKAIVKELPPVAEVIQTVADELPSRKVNLQGLDLDALEESVRDAVKTVVKETIQEASIKTDVQIKATVPS
jgi:cardiolipin synthase A/B